MRRNDLRQILLPLITAFIWGSAFVAQSLSSGHIGPFTFNASRSLTGCAALMLIHLIRRKLQPSAPVSGSRKDLIAGGLCCGFFLALASVLQQAGISTTGAGKAGFITALYVVLVPLSGLFFRRRPSLAVWISVLLATAGLFFLCIRPEEGLSLQTGDLYLLACAFAFTAQILCVDHFVKKTDPVLLSCAQFFVVFLLCSAGALFTEIIIPAELVTCLPYILYVGILSSGVAYTLQIVAQRDGDPVIVSLLLSLESLFAVVTGAIVLHERLSGREAVGCGLMMGAVVLSQLKLFKR